MARSGGWLQLPTDTHTFYWRVLMREVNSGVNFKCSRRIWSHDAVAMLFIIIICCCCCLEFSSPPQIYINTRTQKKTRVLLFASILCFISLRGSIYSMLMSLLLQLLHCIFLQTDNRSTHINSGNIYTVYMYTITIQSYGNEIRTPEKGAVQLFLPHFYVR